LIPSEALALIARRQKITAMSPFIMTSCYISLNP
jgi:hypothetical protein